MEGGALQERVEGARVCPLRSCCSESWLAPSFPRPVSWAPPEQGTVASGSSSHLRGAWSQGWSWPIHSGTGGRRVSGWVAPREDLVCQLLGAPLAVSGRWLGGGLRPWCPSLSAWEWAGLVAGCFGAGGPGLSDAPDHGASLQLVCQLPAAPEGPDAACGASPRPRRRPHVRGGESAPPPAADRPPPPWLWACGQASVVE